MFIFACSFVLAIMGMEYGSHCTYDNHIWTQHKRVRVILFMCIVLYVLRVCYVLLSYSIINEVDLIYI